MCELPGLRDWEAACLVLKNVLLAHFSSICLDIRVSVDKEQCPPVSSLMYFFAVNSRDLCAESLAAPWPLL